ncbi:MAG: hypothetical protein ABI923_06305 [bacterium]
MTHPLDGAYARLDRAMEHLAELKAIVLEFIDREYELAEGSVQFNPQGPIPLNITRPDSPIPPKVSILTGEVVNNLRTALDYLIYQLAILDAKTVQNGTQFPIEDTPAGFQGRSKPYLKGINASHSAKIERLQPYNGVDWTRILRTISNPDKHRHPVIQKHHSTITIKHGKDPAEVFAQPGVKGLFIVFTIPDPTLATPMHMQFHVTIFIAFDDGLRIVETLEQLQTEVAKVLGDFKSEFK